MLRNGYDPRLAAEPWCTARKIGPDHPAFHLADHPWPRSCPRPSSRPPILARALLRSRRISVGQTFAAALRAGPDARVIYIGLHPRPRVSAAAGCARDGGERAEEVSTGPDSRRDPAPRHPDLCPFWARSLAASPRPNRRPGVGAVGADPFWPATAGRPRWPFPPFLVSPPRGALRFWSSRFPRALRRCACSRSDAGLFPSSRWVPIYGARLVSGAWWRCITGCWRSAGSKMRLRLLAQTMIVNRDDLRARS